MSQGSHVSNLKALGAPKNKTQAKARLGFLGLVKSILDHFWNNKMGQILKILLCASRTDA